MIGKRTIAVMALAVLALAGCRRRRPEVNPAEPEDILLNVDTMLLYREYKPVICPGTWKLNMYDITSGTQHFSGMFNGTSYTMFMPQGRSRIIVYNYGSPYALLENETSFNDFMVYSGRVGDMFDKILQEKWRAYQTKYPDMKNVPCPPVVYQPDDLWSGVVKSVTVPLPEKQKTLVIQCDPLTERCKLIVRGIKGAEYITAMDAYLTNVARGKYLGSFAPIDENASIKFKCSTKIETDSSLVSIFNFYGKLSEEQMQKISKLEGRTFESGSDAAYGYGIFNELYLLITDSDGQQFLYNFDVTEQVQENNHIIIVDTDIEVPKPGQGGGIDPNVDEWEDHVILIQI